MTIHRTIPKRRPQAEIGDAAEIQKQIGLANDLLAQRRRAAALEFMENLCGLHPRSAEAWLAWAMMLDGLGRESTAIPIYERALRLGLQGMPLRDALVCCASSYRNVGKLPEAIRMLKRALRVFSQDAVVKLFLALAFHDVGQSARAMKLVALTCLPKLDEKVLSGFRPPLIRKFRALV